jgi:WXG100 family type VII secretion target
MGNGTVHVHVGALSDAAEAAERTADRLAGLLDAVDRVVRLLAGEWTGVASEGFQQTAARWGSASADLHATLRDLRSLLSTAHDNYGVAESANLTMWQVR